MCCLSFHFLPHINPPGQALLRSVGIKTPRGNLRLMGVWSLWVDTLASLPPGRWFWEAFCMLLMWFWTSQAHGENLDNTPYISLHIPFLILVFSFLLPGITSQINYLHKSPCSRLCFLWEGRKLKLELSLCSPSQSLLFPYAEPSLMSRLSSSYPFVCPRFQVKLWKIIEKV